MLRFADRVISPSLLTLGLLTLPVTITASPSSGIVPPAADTTLTVLVHAHAVFDERGPAGLEELQQAAGQAGIDAILVVETLLADWTWAPPVLRWFGGGRLRMDSVVRSGSDRYFETVAAVDRSIPEVTLVAGVEIAPYYRWSGAPWSGSLTMWDWQRNLLVFGLDGPQDYLDLPVLGLRRRTVASWRDIPWLLLVLVAAFGFLYSLNRLRVVPTLLTLTFFMVLLGSGPPPPGPFSPYARDVGLQPWQTLIDSVAVRGGVAMWSQVEARDDQRRLGGLVHIRTEPHPQVLTGTSGYRMFGAIYPSTSAAQEPGREWDRALLDFLAGRRSTPVWGWGEAALHYPSQLEGPGRKRVDEVLSVIRARGPDEASILAALATGRGYSVRAAVADGRLEMLGFQAAAEGERAGSGEWLSTGHPVRVTAGWRYRGAGSPIFTGRLVRDGVVVREWTGVGEGSLVWEEPAPGPVEAHFFRLEVRGRDHRLLTNPVFIRSGGMR